MKKTLIALTIATLTATSANAVTVYNQDGTKLDINGSVRILLDKTTGNRTDLKNDGSRINFAISQNLGDGLSAIGYLRLKVDSQEYDEDSELIPNSVGKFSDLKVNKLYAGFAKENIGILTFGKQDTNADNVQLADYTYKYGDDNLYGNLPYGKTTLKTSTDKGIKFRSTDLYGLSFGVDYGFGSSDKNMANDNNYGLAVFYTTNFAENLILNMNAGYTHEKTDGVSQKAWLTAAEIVTGPVSLALSYGQNKNDQDNAKLNKLIFGAKYQVTNLAKVYAQYQHNSVDATESDTQIRQKADNLNSFTLGTGYLINQNVETFIEYTHQNKIILNNENHIKNQNKIGVGLRVFF